MLGKFYQSQPRRLRWHRTLNRAAGVPEAGGAASVPVESPWHRAERMAVPVTQPPQM